MIGAIGSVSPPSSETIPVANAPNTLGEGPPLNPAIALLYAIIALALFSICVVSNLALENSFNFSKGLLPGNAPNIFEITLPAPPSALPAPNTNKPAPIAAIPLPAAINAAPSNCSKDCMPSAIVGNALPTIHAAPAIAPPISTIAAPNAAAPNTTAGLANAAMPPARPLSMPPRPLPIPLPMPPILFPRPPPPLPPPFEGLGLDAPAPAPPNPILLVRLEVILVAMPPMPLVIAPSAALPKNNAAIPPVTAAIAGAPLNKLPSAPIISPVTIFSTNPEIAVAILVTPSATMPIVPSNKSNIPLSSNATLIFSLTSRIVLSNCINLSARAFAAFCSASACAGSN